MDIISLLRGDVSNGRMLVCSISTVTDYGKIICTPSTRSAENSPCRTLSTEVRIIPDSSLIDNFCDKHGYPACGDPTLTDLSTRVGFSDRGFPGIHRRVTKSDVNDAF